MANKQYSTLKNDYEMTLNGDSTVIPCDDSSDVPTLQYSFVPIGDLEAHEKDAIVGKQQEEGSDMMAIINNCLCVIITSDPAGPASQALEMQPGPRRAR